MSFLHRAFKSITNRHEKLSTKQSRAAQLTAHVSMGLTQWTSQNCTQMVRNGYEYNPIVYRAIRMIAESAASVPWRAYEGRRECADHPILQLLRHPNPLESEINFLEGIYSNLQLFGNAYVEVGCNDDCCDELYNLRPDRMVVVPGADGWPHAYEYRLGGEKVVYPFDPGSSSPILHLKLFHPLDDHYGFAPINAAWLAIDSHQAASQWNKSLLDHAARPSGALVYTDPKGQQLTPKQFDRLKEELDHCFSGAQNAGRPMLLEGGLDWKALSMSPKDMDFNEAKATAAREIALSFGVPPLLLGLPGDNTYANFQEANRAFWRQTIIPLVSRTQKSFEAWLAPVFGSVRLDYDVDRIDALAQERAQEWTRIGQADFLSVDEKREALGYGTLTS